jgi:lactate permease
VLGFGGRELTPEEISAYGQEPVPAGATPADSPGTPAGHWSGSPRRRMIRSLAPFLILIAVVVAWTGPWSSLTKYIPFEPKVTAAGSLGGTVESSWKFEPFIAGTAIMVSWFLIAAFLRPRGIALLYYFVRPDAMRL